MKSIKCKVIAIFFLIISIALSSIVWLSLNQVNVLETKNDNLQSKLNQLQTLKIESFQFDGIYNPVGLIWNYQFKAEILNNGTSDVEGLVLAFDIISNYTVSRQIVIGEPYAAYIEVGEPFSIGIVRQGDLKEVNGFIENNLGDDAKLRGSTFSVTLKLGDNVLDQASINLD